MSSIIEGYSYDIFISYRQNDNKYDGWVTEFVNHLKLELESTFKEDISIYFDANPRDGLLETHVVDESLEEKLKCLIFIPIISQTYCDPKSYAWQYEFCAFNRSAKEDQFGREIRLTRGNVASRILPVKIHELDPEDESLLENELGGVLRCIEFIYKSPGVNRPLGSEEDHPRDNLNKTYYRDQINKVANAIKEIIAGIKNFGKPVSSIPLKGSIISESNLNSKNKSIIVLPFENISSDPDQEYFSDGLTEEIISDLSQIHDLLVISRTSAMTFKGVKKKVQEIAEEVNVQFVLEGSVRKAGNNLRITVQLIDAMNDTHLWADKYTGTIDDVFNIQDKVSRSVVAALKIKLNPEEKKQTANLRAYDLYLLGRYYWNKRTKEGLQLSIEYFDKSIESDNGYALAYAGLADAYYVSADWNYLPSESACQKAKELAQKALSLNDRIAEANATLAGIADNFEYNYEKAESLFKAALSKNPNYATAYQWYADFLARQGRFDEAKTYINQALQLDPLSAIKNYACGLIYYLAGEYDTSLLRFKETLKLDPEFPLIRFQAFLCYFQKGLITEAIDEYQKVLEYDSSLKAYNKNARKIFETGGTKGFLNYLIDLELKKLDPSLRYLALFYSLSGDKQKALDYLEFNVNTYVLDYQYIKVEPAYSVLRAEPRFLALLRKIGYKE